MPTTPINALRYPQGTDAADVPADMSKLALDTDTRLIPRFANATARDAVLTAPNGLTAGVYAHMLDSGYLWYYTGTVWRPIPGVVVGESIRTAGDVTTAAGAATIIQSVTFTAQANVTYLCKFEARIQGTNAGSQAALSFRHATGATVTGASTGVGARFYVVSHASAPLLNVVERRVTATATGQYTIGWLLNFFSGSGNIVVGANANDESVLRIVTAA